MRGLMHKGGKAMLRCSFNGPKPKAKAKPAYKEHDREIAKLEAAHRAATDAGDKEGARMIAAEIARHALQQHHGI